MAPVRVMVVDDAPLICDALAAAFEDDPGFRVAGRARDIHEAMVSTPRFDPDVLVLGLSGADGPGTVRVVARHLAGTSIVLITPDDSPWTLELTVEVGAAGCLSKRATLAQIREVVRVVRASALTAGGLSDEQVAAQLSVSVDELTGLRTRAAAATHATMPAWPPGPNASPAARGHGAPRQTPQTRLL